MKQRAFSLLELLVVMAIIAIIAMASLPAFNNLGRAQALTTAGSSLLDQFALARQTAVAQNRVVEVRFYKRRENPAQPADANSNPERFRSFRTMIYDENVLNAFAQTTMQDFPARVVLSEEKDYSTLIYDKYPTRPLLKETLSSTETNVEYQVIRFKPTGGTDLSVTGTPEGNRWFLTIKSDNPEKNVPTGRPAINFFTVLLDPVSGRVRTYRP